MNINETLASFLEENKPLKVHESNTELNNKLIIFLNSDINKKQTQAENLVKEIMEHHKKGDLAKHTGELYKVESATMSLTGKRDHVVHAINTFILGLYINVKYLNKEVDLFQWKLASLFHDIAYPLEISQKIIERYYEKVHEIQKGINGDDNVSIKMDLFPKNFECLSNNISSFDIFQKRISEWEIKKICIEQKYDEMIKNNKLNHGIISSLTVLYLVDLMYKKNNPKRKYEYINVGGSDWNQKHFEGDIVSACSAIYLHNLHHTNFFAKCKDKSKLVYLLKLCDELQNWERSNNLVSEEDSPKTYDIEILDGKLYFKIKLEDSRNKIYKKIACLNDNSIQVVEEFNEDGK